MKMKNYLLSKKELEMLRLAHKGINDKRKADRIKAVYLLGKGWTVLAVHEALLVDEDTIRNYYARYEDGNLMGLLNDKYIGNQGLLNASELRGLESHLREITYRTAKEVIDYIQEEFNETYSLSGVHELLKRLGFVYKKPQRRPAKLDVIAQERFIRKYRRLCRKLSKDDSVCFMDTTHPQHESSVNYGWIKRGETKEIFTTATQKRLTINGVVDIKRLEMITSFQREMVTAETVKDFLELLRKQKPAGWIYLICDRARYYDNDAIRAYAKSMAIKMVYLPAYSPNLNLIERVWLFFKKSVLYNRYYKTFAAFEMACRDFFVKPHRHKPILKTLLTENFQRFATA
jgi:transposase